MNKILLVSVLALFATPVFAQATSQGIGQSQSDSGAMAQTGAITFESADPLRHQRLDTTPPVYTAPATFGNSNNNCGKASTASIGITGFGFGGALAGESDYCNARLDAGVAWQMGDKDVAKLRFYCFGTPENKKAWLATGKTCPGDEKKQVSGVASSHTDPNSLYIGG